MIVPEIAGAAAPELDDLRLACDTAVERLLAAGPRLVLVVGSDSATREHWLPARGSFARWGAPMEVALGGGPREAVRSSAVDHAQADGRPELPLSLLVGAWLLRRHPARGLTYKMVGVADDAAVEQCARFGAGFDSTTPWALLVMGDGSACRGEKSPGYDDPRAQPYDDGVAAALAGADSDALRGLDPGLSAELAVAGRAPWQVLAGAVQATGVPWRGGLSYYAAPYGVAYFVATWRPVS